MPLTENVTIAVDAMGGDNAPSVVLDGVAAALAEDENLQVVLVGPADVRSQARTTAAPPQSRPRSLAWPNILPKRCAKRKIPPS